jgi:Domain of unknown function (DUF1877)
MGIAYCLLRVRPEIVERLRGRPKAVAEYIYGDADLYEPVRPGLFARLFGRAKSEPVEDTIELPARDDSVETDLDKSWHIIHYLLTGTVDKSPDPLGLIADDTDPIADIDLGLGKPNVISAEAVKAFSEAAAALSEEAFLSRCDLQTMPVSKIYFCKEFGGDSEDLGEYALENFRNLREFADTAANNGEAIVTWYC